MAIDILIFGAGAVGAFYGSRLAHAPQSRVSVVCRSNYNAVKSNGFTIDSPQYGNDHFYPHAVFPNAEAASRSTVRIWDYIVVSTKALPDVSDDSALLEGLVSSTTSIVLIQNGIGVEEPYAKRFPDATILSAVTIASAAQRHPGLIKHNRWTRISIGPYLPPSSPESSTSTNTSKATEEKATARTTTFTTLLRAGGIHDADPYPPTQLQLLRWHKLAINAAMNPTSVLSGGATNAAMSFDADLSLHLKGVMDEVAHAAEKVTGLPFPPSFATPEAVLASTRKNTSGSIPSMLADWQDGKRMELEVILGNPVRIARGCGVEMPRVQGMYAMLRMAQAGREEKAREEEKTGESKL